ncbi:copper-transporting P-type ATPase [Colletotrichum scovillei]|uniref:Cation transport atpase n=1 Tax=Colletotrichum scovillei TaxID=1209932 RepID=A0A9P7QVI6_9PEZI|nr:copper-transporting P-type ATPase [Colletotrichum scovillei]KAF4778689.1 copper-transporting P-type ATPase [Colletotrichum scovillei]KAG7043922.1 cation transport atpase [Colletotrichum scovillei]KAG7046022.1 cation transport atpase [Colletotrichum scovillei]KAG7063371.1 cation transport atpase [Colletotrichum scovillei]
MGAGCCSDEPTKDHGCAGPASGSDHGHEHDDSPRLDDCCAGDGACDDALDVNCLDENCDAETFCDSEDDSTCRSVKLECCTSKEEHCDEKCIIAAAAVECEKSCEDDTAHDGAHEHSHDKDGRHPASACSTHLSKAFEQYSAYLESARCICRSILDRGLPTACCSEQKPVVTAAAAPVKSSAGKKRREPAEAHTTAHAHGQHKHHHHHGIKRRGNKSQAVHDHDMAIKPIRDDQSDCCSGHDVEAPGSAYKKGNLAIDGSVDKDIEKDAGSEHVALVVDGMTCSGCGNKLERTLKGIPGVSGVRVNFVMGNAEFTLDGSAGKAEDIIRNTERATGFHCTRMSSDDQTLDILASGPSAKALTDLAIIGISEVSLIDKRTARVTYDPAVIGARTLFNKIGPHSTGLAPPRDDPSIASGRKRMYDQLIKTAAAATFTIPVVVLAWGEKLEPKTRSIISSVLATFVQLIAVPDFYKPAISSLVHSGAIEMDMLVVISITAAYVYSVVGFGFHMADRPLDPREFFETSTLLITLVLLGRLTAAYARIRAVAAVSLRSLQTSTAVVIEDGKDVQIDARLLQYGDKFKVLPHSVVPTDGLVVTGSSEVDESMLTGESVPVFKKSRDTVIAGTINGSGTLVAQLTRLPGKNTVTDIAELVEEAANSKPRIQDIADRVAGWFVPVVTAVAIIVLVVWTVIGVKVHGEPTGKSISTAITYAIAVLAVSCPCALGLAVPMVLVVAGGIAARGGVIIKSAECTERARKVSDVVFDKTGTITEGDLDVLEEEILLAGRDEARAITKALVAGNNHPVSTALAKYLASRATREVKVTDPRVIPGAGVEASYNGHKVCAGNPSWTDANALPSVIRFQESNMTILVITSDSTPIAIFGLRTRLRSEAKKVVAQLTRRNIAVHLVSGDQTQAVESVAAQVGIHNVASRRTPSQKRDYVASLMSQGKIVMFVGDGTNDAVAVTQADVGVQLGSAASASDVTRGAADVVLLAGLEGIPFVLEVSRASFHRMVFNFVWSAVYNVLAILLAGGAFEPVHFKIPPAYAGLGEMVSVIPVIVAALTMLGKKIRTEA